MRRQGNFDGINGMDGMGEKAFLIGLIRLR
jgi:hypothetical protein